MLDSDWGALRLRKSDPPAKQVRVDAARHCNARHRDARLEARRDGVGLEFVAVQAPTPTAIGNLLRDSAHVSTKSCGGYEAPMCLSTIQDGMTSRLQLNNASAHGSYVSGQPSHIA